MGTDTTEEGLDRITDEDLNDIAARVRSIRHRGTLAKSVGAGVAFVLSVGLFALSYPVFGDEMGTELRFLIAAGGPLIGALVYRMLMPKEDPSDPR